MSQAISPKTRQGRQEVVGQLGAQRRPFGRLGGQGLENQPGFHQFVLEFDGPHLAGGDLETRTGPIRRCQGSVGAGGGAEQRQQGTQDPGVGVPGRGRWHGLSVIRRRSPRANNAGAFRFLRARLAQGPRDRDMLSLSHAERSEAAGSSVGRSRVIGLSLDHPAWTRRRDGAPPLIVAHRGASAVEPENSIAAFRRADADGADGVELDVLACATGEVVVFHDDDLVRLGNRPEKIAGLPLAALREVRLTSGATIPTLDEVLAACGPRLLVNVELKASGVAPAGLRALVDAVATMIDEAGAGMHERVLVSSFYPRAIALWRRRAPRVRAGLLFEREAPLPLRRAWALRWLRPFSAHPEAVLCTPHAVRRWHRRGYAVNVWTVDDAIALRRFAEMGVDAIITNDPARSRRALIGS